MKNKLSLVAVLCAMAASPAVAEFKISFDWAGLKSCTSGRPNVVKNPAFKVSGVPAGTTVIQFKMKDLDVPSYNHGGGWVKMSADGTAPVGAFKYKSPCPPSGSHTYQWTAVAKTKKSGKVLAKAAAALKYP